MHAQRNESGFTLIELLVVIIIIGVLAAIAIPTFLSQREKGWRSQAVSDMKNAATAVESWSTDHDGSYLGLNGADETSAALAGEGFRHGSLVSVQVVSSVNAYCIRGFHVHLADEFVYRSVDGVVRSGTPGFIPC